MNGYLCLKKNKKERDEVAAWVIELSAAPDSAPRRSWTWHEEYGVFDSGTTPWCVTELLMRFTGEVGPGFHSRCSRQQAWNRERP